MDVKKIMASLEAKHPGEKSTYKQYTKCWNLLNRFTTNTPNLQRQKSSNVWWNPTESSLSV